MSSMMQRIITGAIFGVVVIGALLLGLTSFTILLSVICALTLYEYFSLQLRDAHKVYKWVAIVFGVFVFWLYAMSGGYGGDQNFVLEGLLVAFIAFTILDLYLNKAKSYSSYVLQGLFLVPVALGILYDLTVDSGSCIGTFYNKSIPLALLGLTWANDVGAYFSGKFLGKRKLFERISPNKTWGGFYGGVLLTSICSLVLFEFVADDLFRSPDHFTGQIYAVGMAVLVSLFATFGDLYQSYIKRIHGVKDSGNLLPGHGGFWDRFDGFLFVIYGYALFHFLMGL